MASDTDTKLSTPSATASATPAAAAVAAVDPHPPSTSPPGDPPSRKGGGTRPLGLTSRSTPANSQRRTSQRHDDSTGDGASLLGDRDDNDGEDPGDDDDDHGNRRAKPSRQRVEIDINVHQPGTAPATSIPAARSSSAAAAGATSALHDITMTPPPHPPIHNSNSTARDVICACCCLKTTSAAPCQGRKMCLCTTIATLLAVAFGIVMVVLLTSMYSVGPPACDDVEYVRVRHTALISNSSANTTVQVTFENIPCSEFLSRKGLSVCIRNK